MTKAQILVHEIEVVMQAFAVVRYQVCFARLFVVPWLVGRTGLHRREDAHQTRVPSALLQKFLRPVFLPKVPFANELDFDARVRRQSLRVLTNPIAERLGELRIVEYPDLSLEQKRRHPAGKTDSRQSAEDQHPVEATQHAFNLCGVSRG